ncbi:putative exonuclease [Erwinia phage Calisson]|nr:putative exonuclease [Erwinia phage Calisson]
MIIICQLFGLKRKLTFNQKKQHDAMRAVTAERIRLGEIKKTPCEVCGNEIVEGHHVSYSNPKVMFLCSKHHSDWHRRQYHFDRLRTTYGAKFVHAPHPFRFSWVWVKQDMAYRPRPAQSHPGVIRRGQKLIKII